MGGQASWSHHSALLPPQGPLAEAMMRSSIERGKWVFFQNCHLAPSWMPVLERLIEHINPDKVRQPPLLREYCEAKCSGPRKLSGTQGVLGNRHMDHALIAFVFPVAHLVHISSGDVTRSRPPSTNQ